MRVRGAGDQHKHYILTPLLWPSRCVVLVLLMLGFTPSGLPEDPSVGCGLPYHIWSLLSGSLGVAFLTTSGLYSLGVYWQLLWGFSECPLSRVWPSLPHLVSTLWESTGNYLCTPNSTELNNNSTPTRSPTGSLNRMFNRHQAEITVMQFRGHCLPVHDCNGRMGPWPCPIS